MYKSYIKYNKLKLKRSKKETIHILFKNFMQLFTNNDQKTITNTLYFISKISNLLIFLMTVILYFTLGILCSNYIQSILLVGLINSIHILFKINIDTNKSKIEILKDEFKFLFSFIPEDKRNRFVIRKISNDLFSNILLYSLIPYFISQSILSVLYSKSYITSLIILLLITGTNYAFSIFLMLNKINIKSKFMFNVIIGILILLISYNGSILLKSFNFSNFININISKILSIKDKVNSVVIFKYQLWIILINIIITNIMLINFSYLFIKNGKMLINIYANKNINNSIIFKHGETTYKTIVYRELNQENKFLVINLVSIMISVFLLIFHYLFMKNILITFIEPIVIMSYYPVMICTIIYYYLCKDLLRKSNITTNFYFLKKYNCKKDLWKQTLLVIIKHCSVLLLPILTISIIQFSLESIVWFTSQLFTFLCVSIIVTQRFYNISKNTIEDFESISPISLTTNSFEDYCIFGSPVILITSLIAYTLKSNIGYRYIDIALILYTIAICSYTLLKVFLFYKKENIYD